MESIWNEILEDVTGRAYGRNINTPHTGPGPGTLDPGPDFTPKIFLNIFEFF